MDASLTEQGRALVADNIRLAYSFAGRIAGTNPGWAEEIESAALLGLCRAAVGFDPSRGFRFTTYAYACMKTEVFNELRKLRAARSAECVSLDATEPGAWHCDPPDRREPAPDESAARSLEVEALDRCLARLPERERFIIRRLKLEGATLEQVGRELGEREGRDRPISKERVRQLAIRARSGLAMWLRLAAGGKLAPARVSTRSKKRGGKRDPPDPAADSPR